MGLRTAEIAGGLGIRPKSRALNPLPQAINPRTGIARLA